MQVLVAGGTGFIGTHLCRVLVDRGHDVTALSRSPESTVGDLELPSSVDRVAGDVTSYDSIAGTVDGVDAVVNLVSLTPLFQPRGDADHETVHLGGTENLVRAAEDGGVDRFVQVSGLDADPAAPTAYLRAKGRAESVVRESTLEWVIVRPSVVFGDGSEFLSFTTTVTTPYLTGLPGGGRTRFQPIWIGDLAPMLAACVEDEDRRRVTYELGGPEVLTLADVTRAVYAARGQSVRIVPVPMPLAKLGLRLAGPLPLVPFGPDQARSLEIDNTVDDGDLDAFDRDRDQLESLEEYLEERHAQAADRAASTTAK